MADKEEELKPVDLEQDELDSEQRALLEAAAPDKVVGGSARWPA